MAKATHAERYRRLPRLLRQIREGANLTQRDMAKKLRMSPSIVHKTEVGDRRTDVAEFLDWCRACGADPVEAFRMFVTERDK